MIGICGAGMQALAEVLLQRGWSVSGSDLSVLPAQWLRDRGVPLCGCHSLGQLAGREQLVIFSDAVSR